MQTVAPAGRRGRLAFRRAIGLVLAVIGALLGDVGEVILGYV